MAFFARKKKDDRLQDSVETLRSKRDELREKRMALEATRKAREELRAERSAFARESVRDNPAVRATHNVAKGVVGVGKGVAQGLGDFVDVQTEPNRKKKRKKKRTRTNIAPSGKDFFGGGNMTRPSGALKPSRRL